MRDAPRPAPRPPRLTGSFWVQADGWWGWWWWWCGGTGVQVVSALSDHAAAQVTTRGQVQPAVLRSRTTGKHGLSRTREEAFAFLIAAIAQEKKKSVSFHI